MVEKLTTEELKELMELYSNTQTTPVISLTGKPEDDWSKWAYDRFTDKWAEIAKKHGTHPTDGFNPKTGEIIVGRR